MNEFEKWLAKNHPNANDLTIAMYKEAWKAAINWTNTRCRASVTLHDNIYSEVNAELIKLESE